MGDRTVKTSFGVALTYFDCVIGIRGNGDIVLISDNTEYKEGETGLEEILDIPDGMFEQVSNDINEQGKCFRCQVVLRSWRDSTPDSCDWNLEVDFENLIELK